MHSSAPLDWTGKPRCTSREARNFARLNLLNSLVLSRERCLFLGWGFCSSFSRFRIHISFCGPIVCLVFVRCCTGVRLYDRALFCGVLFDCDCAALAAFSKGWGECEGNYCKDQKSMHVFLSLRSISYFVTQRHPKEYIEGCGQASLQ